MLVDFMKISTVDYPKKIAATCFFGGCNFSCPFCYNSQLVNFKGEFMDDNIFFEYLDKRKGIVDAVCITGGEPTLNEEYLTEFIKKIKNRSLLVKLDTNGSRPEVLQRLLDAGLLDYVAMDVKAPLEKYPQITGFSDVDKIRRSIEILKNSNIDYEFRTTVNKHLHTVEDILNIARLLKDAKLYVIKPYKYTPEVLNEKISGTEDLEIEYLQEIYNRAKQEGIDNIKIGGKV
ncbi:anaerobic ribonucleoside-triphosphate reductase activating protein [Caldicellulosiruptor obsidiansis OB47]|uniref:Anaerobic ribonucleoside-triphosphate reductase activating protein n=1 Tax=Caldicellulosiruptor obsidiansis (strain ATCC BAA-2073 / JCM 16842 / OB47) TaxID=608506 RepID=D9TI08_CALOO|nr:anaerobic ribonucleoside-triphosphate reductase activating protein [Caldicellulosiruptor obsidiansis]ADL41640.1 anaerobic ribonucleoside-triphosphate reductase activating protein [Caldicellulosiruptor obsidiansis OB47]